MVLSQTNRLTEDIVWCTSNQFMSQLGWKGVPNYCQCCKTCMGGGIPELGVLGVPRAPPIFGRSFNPILRGLYEPGMPRMPGAQSLADKLTLFQPGGQIMPTKLLLSTVQIFRRSYSPALLLAPPIVFTFRLPCESIIEEVYILKRVFESNGENSSIVTVLIT